MIIRIFEGPKGTGKSKLIKRFSTEYPNAEVLHLTQFTNNSINNLNRMTLDPNKEYILDRGYMGEFVYPYVYKRAADYTLASFMEEACDELKQVPVEILTAESDQLDTLFHRITRRDSVTLYEEEKLQIVHSNQLFTDYGNHLQLLLGKNVTIHNFLNYNVEGIEPLATMSEEEMHTK